MGRVAKAMNSAVIVRRSLALVRWALGLVFLYAGVVKIAQTQDFAYDVQSYQLTSWTVSILIAVYLPWLETVTALALLTKRLYLGALVVAVALASVFLGAIISAWQRGLDITCGCFGPEINKTNYPLHISADLALLAVAALLLINESRSARRDGTVK